MSADDYVVIFREGGRFFPVTGFYSDDARPVVTERHKAHGGYHLYEEARRHAEVSVEWGGGNIEDDQTVHTWRANMNRADAWDAGWEAHRQQELKQLHDPKHAIYRDNPYRGEA